MENTDLAYYRLRHAEEIRAAAETAHPCVAARHAELTELYAARVARGAQIQAECATGRR